MRLAAEGAHVTLVARRTTELSRVQKEIETAGGKARSETCDLRDPTRIDALTTRLAADRVDILVNVGGAFHRGEWKSAPPGDLDDMYQVNVRGIVQLTQGVLPAMQHGGDVVFVNSTVVYSDGRNVAYYAAMQHALTGLADALRAEVNESGIRVLSVYPGRTATPRQAEIFRSEGRVYDPARLLQPGDVAEAVCACLRLADTAEVTDLRIRPRNKH